jgi:beta-lactamase class A
MPETQNPTKSKRNKLIKALLHPASWLILGLLIGAASSAAIVALNFSGRQKALFDQIHPIRLKNSPYQFINPLLGYALPDSTEFKAYQPLDAKVNNFINSAKSNGQATDVSVYFRDFSQGRWFGINENEKYAPASLLKVVILIAYLKLSETNPKTLSNQLPYDKNMDDAIGDVPYQAPSTLEIGKSYSAEQLLEKMIINSDNGAKNLLLNKLADSDLSQVYTDLGIQNPGNVSGDYVISAKVYSFFFRILYNATYLNKDLSEQALQLLSQAQYNDGLVAGLPPGTKIAQKFGERINVDSNGQPASAELHNCGVIYATHPYTLCVMTKGPPDIGKLAGVIKGISNIVFQEIESDYQKNVN